MIIISADVWFRRDVENALNAVQAAGLETVAVSGDRSYERGYAAAIRTMGLIFGINADVSLPRREPHMAQLRAGD